MVASVPAKSVNDHNAVSDLVRRRVVHRRERANIASYIAGQKKFLRSKPLDTNRSSAPFRGWCRVAGQGGS